MNVPERLGHLQDRDKPLMIYQYLNVTRPYATLNVQVKPDNEDPEAAQAALLDNRMVLLVRHEMLPTLKACDFIQPLQNVNLRDGGWI